MNMYLFNILQSARHVKDLLVDSGPAMLRHGADALAGLAETARRAADYIEQYGPSVQFQQGQGDKYQGGIDHPDAQSYLAELRTIRDLAAKESAAQDGEVQRQAGAGIKDWLGKMDPAMKKRIWDLLSGILTSVLTKSGVSLQGGVESGASPTANQPANAANKAK